MLHRARLYKETKYQELLRCERCHLVVVELGTGGRWSNEAAKFVDSLPSAGACEAPPLLHWSASWRGAKVDQDTGRIVWQSLREFFGHTAR